MDSLRVSWYGVSCLVFTWCTTLTFQTSVNNNTNIALIVSVSSSRSWVLNVPSGQEHQAVQVYFWPEGYSRACHVEGEDLKITPCNVSLLQD